MPIFDVRFLNAADATLLIYVTIADRMPSSVTGLSAARDLSYSRWEVWCGPEKLAEGQKDTALSSTPILSSTIADLKCP